MSTCGGIVTTQRVVVGKTPIQLVSALETRTRMTVRADPRNEGTILLVATPSGSKREGFPLTAGEGFGLDDRGTRAALYAVTEDEGEQIAYVLTEGA